MSSARIKVCGITQIADAKHLESLGVDALGFVFVARSKRFIAIESAAQISLQLGPFMSQVGLFLNASEHEVWGAIEAIPQLQLQFHGAETPEYCDRFRRPYIKTIGLGSGMPAAASLQAYGNASAFLFDSNSTGELGGTGHTFDWQQLQNYSGKPLILAGGLNADNVALGIRTVQPYAVDVSTGVESAPGVKDKGLITAFVQSARSSN